MTKKKKKINIDELQKKIFTIYNETKELLLSDMENWEIPSEYSEYTIDFILPTGRVSVWIANGEEYCRFYDSCFCGLRFGEEELGITKAERKKLWKFAQECMAKINRTARITKKSLGNDLFFSFKGVYELVKFSGYDDSDWWTKYAPRAIKEAENIEWEIDLVNMTAKLKKITK